MTDKNGTLSIKADGNAPSAISLRHICKRFGAVQANDDISLEIPAGDVYGIIGENGAGKSTLMGIMYGFHQADSGEIDVGGVRTLIASPCDALALGIGMVHQHFMLVETFTVLENVVLGCEGGARLAPGLDVARKALTALAEEYELHVDLDAVVAHLPVGLRQRVEILKALYRGADTLILDEPTGVLTPQEADHLFRILEALRAQGKTIILITHKLREIMAITQHVAVMRQGKIVAYRKTQETSSEELAELMVGRKVLMNVEKTPANPTERFLQVDNLMVKDSEGVMRVKDACFHVDAGEIVGIAGVSGNGQSELMAALAGIQPYHSGQIKLKGQTLEDLDPVRARALKVNHVPEDRQRDGLIGTFKAYECMMMGYHTQPEFLNGLLLSEDKCCESTSQAMEDFDVRPANPHLRATNFSGGNQQKIILAREIRRDPDFLLVGQPTRGVDIGAIEFIHKRLIEMRDAGKAILLVSVELDEILSLADRILVMFDGQIMGEISADQASKKEIGLMMAGVV
ncbi:MAG: ABC transporter ATP-binding protein [Pseudomonadota bacterium]